VGIDLFVKIFFFSRFSFKEEERKISILRTARASFIALKIKKAYFIGTYLKIKR